MEETILKNWFDAYNQRDWDSIKNIYSDDAIVHGKEGDLIGGQSVVNLAKKGLVSFPDARINPLFFSWEDDVFIVHWRVEGTFENSILDIPATNEKVVFHGLTCFRCKDDKVIEHWAAVDYRPLTFAPA